MITSTTQLSDCELGLSGRQNDAPTSFVVKYNGRNITTLPDEMLDTIFSNLDLQDVFNSRCVSQRWKGVIDDHQIVPHAFYRCHPLKRSPNPYTVEHYDSSTKGWLNEFGVKGKKSMVHLDQHLENKFFPQILCWSVAQVLGRTKAFSCESILTIEHSSFVVNAYFSRDGKQITTASEDGTTKIYGLNDRQWQKKATKIIEHFHSNSVINTYFSPDRKHCVTTFWNNTAKIYELEPIDREWQEQATIEHGGLVNNGCFSPDKKHLVTASDDQTARIYELIDNEWQKKVVIEHDDTVHNACFSADRKHLVTASYDGTAKIYGLIDKEWQEKATIKHDGWVNNACFSADGKQLVTASYDGTAKIYGLNGRQWQEKATIKHDGPVNSACFNPDGKYVMTASRILGINPKYVANVYMLIDNEE